MFYCCCVWREFIYNYNPITDLDRPWGLQEVELPYFSQSAHEGSKVVSPTHRPPLPPGNIPGTHFCWRLSQPQGHSAVGRIISMKNFSDTIENRTRSASTSCATACPFASYKALCSMLCNKLVRCATFVKTVAFDLFCVLDSYGPA